MCALLASVCHSGAGVQDGRMRALLAQTTCGAGAIERNLRCLQDLLSEHPRAQLALFPELFLQGCCPASAAERAIAIDDEPIAMVMAAAKRCQTAVIVGFAERLPDGALANSAACIDMDGSLAGVHRKTQLFGDVERAIFSEGQQLHLVSLAGWMIGPLICFEAEFPEHARALARVGADLLVTIAANMEPYGAEQELACRARALENRRPHLYVNGVGACEGMRFPGGSCAIDRDGRAILSAGEQEQALEVDIGRTWLHAGSDVDYLQRVRFRLPVMVANTQMRERRGERG
jgi:(R)-amidase